MPSELGRRATNRPRLRELDGYGFPLGEVPASVAGTTVHAILEQWNWDLPDALPAVVECELVRAGLQPRWQPVVGIDGAAHGRNPAGPAGLDAGQCAWAGRLEENAGIHLPLRRLSVAAVQQWLQRPQSGVDLVFADASRQLGSTACGDSCAVSSIWYSRRAAVITSSTTRPTVQATTSWPTMRLSGCGRPWPTAITTCGNI